MGEPKWGAFPGSKHTGLPPQERRLTKMEHTQAQLKDSVHDLQLVLRTPGSLSQPLPLQAPCVNGDTT